MTTINLDFQIDTETLFKALRDAGFTVLQQGDSRLIWSLLQWIIDEMDYQIENGEPSDLEDTESRWSRKENAEKYLALLERKGAPDGVIS